MTLIDLAREWKPDPTYDSSCGVRDILWEEIPEAQAAILASEGRAPGEPRLDVPEDTPYMYFLALWDALFLPAVETGDLPILHKIMKAFERTLAMGSEVVEESFDMVFLKDLRSHYDTLGAHYGPLLRQKVLASME
ncbi:hypothetical protein [Sphaerisporangium siamense]|uniref:DUF7674 domain-containing protein n=1 Tax=Sphaerisporangium siamense TaxID=795645 RepID=A0A7W7GDC6_9ACTN|nr:hypothetical protein [Sphaerisporangium siamense]MBB4704830.1 hypothetical protein [Sphaerisporangium siamense]